MDAPCTTRERTSAILHAYADDLVRRMYDGRLVRRACHRSDQQARSATRPRKAWTSCGVRPLNVYLRNPHGCTNEWRIEELLDSHALPEEGREVRNCVRISADACLQRKSAIWSLRIRRANEQRTRSIFAIEIDRRRRSISAVRGRCNQSLQWMRPSPTMRVAVDLLGQWPQSAELTIDCSLRLAERASSDVNGTEDPL